MTQDGRPRIWDFGSAAKAHRLQLPHMYDTDNSVGGNTGCRGRSVRKPVSTAAAELRQVLESEGLAGERLVDMARPGSSWHCRPRASTSSTVSRR